MRIRVTQEHIARGTRGGRPRNPGADPVSLALADACPGFWQVGSQYAYVTRDDGYGKEQFRSPVTYVYLLPPEVTDRICDMVRGKTVAPFEFDMNLPDQSE